jgi:hypothetical protein
MKVGSLVVFIGCAIRNDINIIWIPKIKEEVITIRAIRHSMEPNAVFEEGVIGHNKAGMELGIRLDYLKEVQSPEDGAEIVEEIKRVQEPAGKCFEMRE